MEVVLGRIINVRGLKGELKIDLSTEFVKKRFKKGEKVILNEGKLLYPKSKIINDLLVRAHGR